MGRVKSKKVSENNNIVIKVKNNKKRIIIIIIIITTTLPRVPCYAMICRNKFLKGIILQK
jgi:hypothetical protein